MAMTPDRNHRRLSGWLALSPLVVFLCVYLVSSIIVNDFYAIPISAAFLIASVYAVMITGGRSLEERISIFSEGAGNKNVLLMIWIFVLAGAFASTAKEIGAIDATVNLALRILPGNLIYAGLFLAACFISMSIGTSVGTIVALVPVAAGIAQEIGAADGCSGVAFITAIIVGIVCIFLGVRNMMGDISTLHSYHRARVKEEDVKPFGKMVGLGTIIIGGGIILFGILSIIADLLTLSALVFVGTGVLIAAIVVGLVISFVAMKKYNGGIF
jgi:hypothetical protein